MSTRKDAPRRHNAPLHDVGDGRAQCGERLPAEGQRGPAPDLDAIESDGRAGGAEGGGEGEPEEAAPPTFTPAVHTLSSRRT